MAISYVVDVYHRRFPLASWIDVTLYLSFFPHLVAGPIVRPEELIPQLDVRRDARHVDVVGAGWLILGGLFKKVVIANYLATAIVDQVFNEPARHGWQEILVGIVAYAVQIYCDFSGYTDIAIGVAKLLGFQFPQNFDRPYSAPLDPGVLASLAHDAVALAARLPLHPARWEPQGHRAHLREPDDHDAARRVCGTARPGTSWSGAACTGSIW